MLVYTLPNKQHEKKKESWRQTKKISEFLITLTCYITFPGVRMVTGCKESIDWQLDML